MMDIPTLARLDFFIQTAFLGSLYIAIVLSELPTIYHIPRTQKGEILDALWYILSSSVVVVVVNFISNSQIQL